MKIIEKSNMPDGTDLILEDWSEVYPGTCGLEIGAYPIAKNNGEYGWIRSGERFRLTIPSNKYVKYSDDDVRADFEALKNGEKRLEDLASHFWDREKAMYYLGMI